MTTATLGLVRPAGKLLHSIGVPIRPVRAHHSNVDKSALVVAMYEEIPAMGLHKMTVGEYRDTDALGGSISISDDGMYWTYWPVSGHSETHRVGFSVRVPTNGDGYLEPYGPAMVLDPTNPFHMIRYKNVEEEFMNRTLRP